jgi:hypothetical protein
MPVALKVVRQLVEKGAFALHLGNRPAKTTAYVGGNVTGVGGLPTGGCKGVGLDATIFVA